MRLLCVFLLLGVCLEGCSPVPRSAEHSGRVHFSPDGEWVAYLWGKNWFVQSGPEPVMVRQTIWFCWAKATEPGRQRRLKIAESGAVKHGSSMLGQVHFEFSAEGSHVAIACPGRLVIVDLKTGDRRDIRLGDGEVISSLRWLDSKTLGYVTYVKSGEGAGAQIRRTFWRQAVYEGPDARTAIHVDTSIEYAVASLPGEGIVDEWPQEYWAPNGRYVIFRGASRPGSARLLVVESGEVRSMGPGDAALVAAAWKPDSSAVFWISSTGFRKPCRAFLLILSDAKPIDLSADIRRIFGNFEPRIEPLWTPDGQFVVGSTLELGGYLIRPRPWEVRLLGQALKSSGGLDGASVGPEFREMFGGLDVPPEVRRQPAPGILIASWGSNTAVVDYKGRVLQRLGDGGHSGWTVSPDGRKAVSVQLGGKIVVVNLVPEDEENSPQRKTPRGR